MFVIAILNPDGEIVKKFPEKKRVVKYFQPRDG